MGDLIEQVAYLRDEAERFHREARDSAEQAGRAIRERDEARAEVKRLEREASEMADWAGVNVNKVRAVRAACDELRRQPFDPVASLDVGEVLRIFEEAIGDEVVKP